MAVGKLVGMVFFGSWLNFNRLQYNTDIYVRRYGYRTMERIQGSEI
jgi:hypothetical protein